MSDEDLRKQGIVLYAEDDDDDYLLVKDAFEEAGVKAELRRVKDGEELMEYLFHRGRYENSQDTPRVALVLLDLNMPKKDGREALREIKSHPQLRRLPVIVLTTSRAEEDVFRAYDMGVNSFIRKPIHFDKFVEMAQGLAKFWLEVATLPKN